MNMYAQRLKYRMAVLLVIALLLVPAPLFAEDIIDEEGNINEEVFEREWRKYSDFPAQGQSVHSDANFPLQSRSWEVQQFYGTQDQIQELKYEALLLEAEMEYDRQMRLELREYRKNLVQNIRVNLLKSFWRLSFMTYDTIKTGRKLGKSYAKLFTAESAKTVVEGLSNIKNALDVVDGLTPKDEKSELVKALSSEIGVLEDLDKVLTNPLQIAVVAAERVKGQADKFLPKAEITEEEIQILRTQHLNREALDEVLQESYRENIIRRDRVKAIEGEIAELQAKQVEWELAEKNRVREMLLSSNRKRSLLPWDCFIATAVYGTPEAEEIAALREFRDEVLLSSWSGRHMVSFYYQFSPPVASFLAEHETARAVVRKTLVEPALQLTKLFGKLAMDPEDRREN